MTRLNLALVFVVLLTSGTTAFGDWIYNPGTGHWYTLSNPGNWAQAEVEAVAAGGHLVTINSAAEDQWLADTFNPGAVDWIGWIGLYQDTNDPTCTPNCEPSGGWKWVSGQPLAYINWGSGEPNNDNGVYEDWVVLGEFPPLAWIDLAPGSGGYPAGGVRGIIEREFGPTVPTVSGWGLGLLMLFVTISGTVLIKRRMKVT